MMNQITLMTTRKAFLGRILSGLFVTLFSSLALASGPQQIIKADSTKEVSDSIYSVSFTEACKNIEMNSKEDGFTEMVQDSFRHIAKDKEIIKALQCIETQTVDSVSSSDMKTLKEQIEKYHTQYISRLRLHIELLEEEITSTSPEDRGPLERELKRFFPEYGHAEAFYNDLDLALVGVPTHP